MKCEIAFLLSYETWKMNETFCNFKLNNEKETFEFKIKSHNNEINFPNKENENSNLKLSKKVVYY